MTNSYSAQAAACIRAYRPFYNELYTLCLAVTGTHRSAREALADAMILQPERPARRKALSECRKASLLYAYDAEGDAYDSLSSAPGIETQDSQVRRCAFLHYGCGLTASEIAKILRVRKREVHTMLRSALASLPAGNAEKRTRVLKKLCLQELRQGSDVPDEETFRYALEKRLRLKIEAEDVGNGGGKRFLSWLAAVMTLAAIGFMIWVGSLVLNYYHLKSMEEKEPERQHVEVQWDR